MWQFPMYDPMTGRRSTFRLKIPSTGTIGEHKTLFAFVACIGIALSCHIFPSKRVNEDGPSVWVQQDGLKNPLVVVPKNFPQTPEDLTLAFGQPVTDFSLNSQHRHKCCPKTGNIMPGSSHYDLDHWAEYSNSICTQGEIPRLRCRSKNTTETIPDIHRIGILRSKLPRPQMAIGIVTDLNINELDLLQHQCLNWSQTISAALYIPLVRGKVYSSNPEWDGMILMQALHLIDVFHKNNDQEGNCQLDIEIVAEERCNGGDAKLYPGGALRNRALHLSTTEIVLLLDNNCIVAKSLDAISSWQKEFMYARLMEHTIILLQTFETRHQDIDNAIQMASKDKEAIVEELKLGSVFLSSLCNFSLDYRKIIAKFWMKNVDPVKVHYNSGYFPNMIMLKKYVPYYDERIYGQAATNVLHMMDIGIQCDFDISMDPQHYVVRLPSNNSTKQIDVSDVQEKYKTIIDEAYHEMKGNCYAPVAAFPHLCLPGALQRSISNYNVVRVRVVESPFLKMTAAVDVNLNEQMNSGLSSIIATKPLFYKNDRSKKCRVRLPEHDKTSIKQRYS